MQTLVFHCNLLSFFLKGAIIPAIQPLCLTKTISFSPCILSLNHWGLTRVCPTLLPSWTTACQAPLSMELSRKNAGLSCHCLLQGVFLNQRSNLCLLHWQAIIYHWTIWVHVLSIRYLLSCLVFSMSLLSLYFFYFFKLLPSWDYVKLFYSNVFLSWPLSKNTNLDWWI